jgi:hypothetical protein
MTSISLDAAAVVVSVTDGARHRGSSSTLANDVILPVDY